MSFQSDPSSRSLPDRGLRFISHSSRYDLLNNDGRESRDRRRRVLSKVVNRRVTLSLPICLSQSGFRRRRRDTPSRSAGTCLEERIPNTRAIGGAPTGTRRCPSGRRVHRENRTGRAGRLGAGGRANPFSDFLTPRRTRDAGVCAHTDANYTSPVRARPPAEYTSAETREAEGWHAAGGREGGREETEGDRAGVDDGIRERRVAGRRQLARPDANRPPNPKLISRAPLSRGPTGSARSIEKEGARRERREKREAGNISRGRSRRCGRFLRERSTLHDSRNCVTRLR